MIIYIRRKCVNFKCFDFYSSALSFSVAFYPYLDLIGLNSHYVDVRSVFYLFVINLLQLCIIVLSSIARDLKPGLCLFRDDDVAMA